MAEAELRSFLNYVVAEVANIGIDLQRLQDEQCIFAEEAFRFLSWNAHLWVEYPNNFLFLHEYPRNCRLFTPNIAKAVVAQAYINRVKCREIFLGKQDELSTVEGYERFITEFTVLKGSLYFYNFLIWTSTIFELTMFCYKRGYDYTDCGKQCLARYPDILYFYFEGGWATFDDSVTLISSIIDQVSLAHLKSTWFDEQTLVFIKYRKAFERRNRYESNDWMKLIHGMINANDVKQKVSAVFRVVSSLDPSRVISGYKVILKNISPVQCKEEKRDILVKKEKPFAAQSQHVMGSGNELSTSKTATKIRRLEISEVGSESFSFHVEYDIPKTDKSLCASKEADNKGAKYIREFKKSCPFVISERYLKKKDIGMEPQNHRCDIKICSSEGDYFVKNLNEVINENIDRKKYYNMDQRVFAVCQPVCDYEGIESPVVVLDTSSEEEDDEEIDIPQLQFKFEQYVGTQERATNRLFNSSEKLQSENVYVCTEVPKQRSYRARNAGAILNIKSSMDNHRNNLQSTYQTDRAFNTDQKTNQNDDKLNENYNVQEQLEHCTGEVMGDEISNMHPSEVEGQIIPKCSTGTNSKLKTSTEDYQNNLQPRHPCIAQYEKGLSISQSRKRPEDDCYDQQSQSYPKKNTGNETTEPQSNDISVNRNKKSFTKRLRSVSRMVLRRRRK